MRLTIQEDFKLEASLTTACELLHSAVKLAAIEVSADENTSKEYEAISALMIMIDLVEEYKLKFDNLSWKYQTILSEILDAEQN